MNKFRNLFQQPALSIPLLICIIGIATGTMSLFVVFTAMMENEKGALSHIVDSQASLMEAVAIFDRENSADEHPDGAFGATIDQIAHAHSDLAGFGNTGEFVIGKLVEGKVALMQPHDYAYQGEVLFQVPDIVPVPMTRALSGERGIIIDRDYKGNQVLAAYRPVPVLGIGLVAKIDMSEIYGPFLISGGIAFGLIALMLVLGVYASRKFSHQYALLGKEKKRAEQYLNIAGSIIVALDGNGDIELINERGCEILGYDRGEIIGKSWFDIAIPEKERDQIKQVFRQFMSDGKDGALVENFENEIVDREGNHHMVAWHNSYLYDEYGKIRSCLSAGEDITDYRKAEKSLQVSERRFTESQRFANIGTWDWNVQTGELYWSDRIGPLFGYDEGALETTYENFLNAIHPDDRQMVMDAVTACVEEGAEYNIQHRVVWPDGRIRWLHESGDVVRDEDGKPLNMLGVVQDVTVRVWAEDEIKRLSRRNELILNTAGEGIYGVNLNGECTFVNPTASKLLGFKENELIGQQQHALLHHSHADGSPLLVSECPVCAAFRDGQVHVNTNDVFWRKDGSSFPVEYTSTPIYEDGEIKGAVVVFRDVTEQKELQAHLIQSSKMATLGEMATGVAHELNQPLNIIRMIAGNVQRKLEKPSIDKEYLLDKIERVASQVERASAIIDHMRIFGRKSGSEPTLLDPRDIVDGVLGLIGEQLRLSGIEVKTEFPETCNLVLGHQVQFEQVFLNLISNARDAVIGVDGGPRQIKITVKDNKQQVFILVQDTGGGISTEAIDRVFEPFFTTKEVGKGTGLGLSISYGIINDAGGTIEARNVGDGACFTVTLPAQQASQAA